MHETARNQKKNVQREHFYVYSIKAMAKLNCNNISENK